MAIEKKIENTYNDGLEMVANAASVLYMRKNNFVKKSKTCPLAKVDNKYLDYKNIKLLEQCISERGKILPSRITNICSRKQRLLARAIKRARVLAFLPFEKV